MKNLIYQVQRIRQRIATNGEAVWKIENLRAWHTYEEAKMQISQFKKQLGISYQIVVIEL